MNKFLKNVITLGFCLALIPSAFATGSHNPLQPSASAGAEATAKATVGNVSGGNGGSGYASFKYKEANQAASAANSASSNTTAKHRYLEQWSASILIGSVATTKMLRDLVGTLEEELNPYQKLALCIESGDYRELRYYISTLPPENGKPQEGACPVGGGSKRIMSSN